MTEALVPPSYGALVGRAAPDPHRLPEDLTDWLEALGGPTLFRIRGRDSSRCRAVCALQHGNEPSGARALLRWLRQGELPAVDTLCIIASVRTALAPPLLNHRHLPGARDLNRCFREPWDVDDEGKLAKAIRDVLAETRPEALIDLHNTSGASPAYAIATMHDVRAEYLTACFARQLIVTDLRLGTLMEAVEDICPAITVECGRAHDAAADEVAYHGLKRYLHTERLFETEAARSTVAILKHPLRVELAPDAVLALGDTACDGADLTLHVSIEAHNFCTLPTGQALGWLGPRGLDCLVVTRRHENIVHALFAVQDGQLVTTRPLRLLMVTTRLDIARSDCLFYAVLEHAVQEHA